MASPLITPPTPPPAPPEGSETPTQKPKGVDNKEIAKQKKAELEASDRHVRSFHTEWKRNVDLRLGKLASVYTGGVNVEDDIQTEINPDWALTKTKTANLFSQVPTVQLTHENKQYAAAVAPFAKALNYEMGDKRANVAVPMEEVLNDVVNAAGVGAVVVGYAARFITKQVPNMDVKTIPPEQLSAMLASGQLKMEDQQVVASDKFYASRISPGDLRWPKQFRGSNFDEADWVGYRGTCSWAEGKHDFKLKDEDREKIEGGVEPKIEEDLRSSADRSVNSGARGVSFTRIFYWRYRVDPDETSFHAIWELVFVDGLTEPAKHEPWTGQRYDEQRGSYVGACKFPVRVLTLTYVSDNPVPPSDSSAGRPQVNDLRRSRSQMFQNRQRSTPLRWFDVNRIDQLLWAQLMKGTYQGMIPTNGDGGRSIGEIARASYPSEDFSFDAATKADLMEVWQIGPNQMGTIPTGEKATKAEVQTTQASFATRIGQERARVGAFFLSIAEVLAGLLALYSDFPVLTDQERQAMFTAWDDKHVLHDLAFKMRPDATIMLDAQTRVQRLMQLLNMVAKSGFVNPMPIITEIVELSGLDPSEVMKPPAPPPPPPPPTLRLSGKDDLNSPMVMALLLKNKQAPSPEDVNAAKILLAEVAAPVKPLEAVPGAPNGPNPHPNPAPPPGAHPDWNAANKVVKRSRDMSGGGG